MAVNNGTKAIPITMDQGVPQGSVLVKHSGNGPDYFYSPAPTCLSDIVDLSNKDPFTTEISLHPLDLSTYNKNVWKNIWAPLNPGVTNNYAWVPIPGGGGPAQPVPAQLMFPEFGEAPLAEQRVPKCECGSASVGSQHHSDWCPAKIAG